MQILHEVIQPEPLRRTELDEDVETVHDQLEDELLEFLFFDLRDFLEEEEEEDAFLILFLLRYLLGPRRLEVRRLRPLLRLLREGLRLLELLLLALAWLLSPPVAAGAIGAAGSEFCTATGPTGSGTGTATVCVDGGDGVDAVDAVGSAAPGTSTSRCRSSTSRV